jgi:hypothetical protein
MSSYPVCATLFAYGTVRHCDGASRGSDWLVDFDTCKWSLTSFHLFPAYISAVLGIEAIR